MAGSWCGGCPARSRAAAVQPGGSWSGPILSAQARRSATPAALVLFSLGWRAVSSISSRSSPITVHAPATALPLTMPCSAAALRNQSTAVDLGGVAMTRHPVKTGLRAGAVASGTDRPRSSRTVISAAKGIGAGPKRVGGRLRTRLQVVRVLMKGKCSGSSDSSDHDHDANALSPARPQRACRLAPGARHDEFRRAHRRGRGRRIIAAAAEAGVNLIDTADTYAGWPVRGESSLGRAIAGDRHRWVLATKLANPTAPGRTAAACRANGSCRRCRPA